jgi:hypothetical protein
MRSLGAILSFFCGLIAMGLLCFGYIGIFDETQVVPDFESTPREGWDYWMRLEHWHDVRSYSLWILMALGGVMIPALGFIRSKPSNSARKVTDRILVGISGLYLVAWSWVISAVALRRPELDWVIILPLVMFAGSLYGLVVFLKRVRTS